MYIICLDRIIFLIRLLCAPPSPPSPHPCPLPPHPPPTRPPPEIISAYRTNRSYQRWDEARKAWGLNINRSRDLVRQAVSWTDPTLTSTDPLSLTDPDWAESEEGGMLYFDVNRRKDSLIRVSNAVWAFNRCLMRHLSNPKEDEDKFEVELRSKLSPELTDQIIGAVHRPNRAMQELSAAVNGLPMHFLRRTEIDRDVMVFENTCGGCERLFSSPIPIFYTRWTARFLSLGLLLSPFALWDSFRDTWNHAALIPAAAILSLFLFGIEELAVQLEEPFSILPMQGFCDKIGANVDEIVEFGTAGFGDDDEE